MPISKIEKEYTNEAIRKGLREKRLLDPAKMLVDNHQEILKLGRRIVYLEKAIKGYEKRLDAMESEQLAIRGTATIAFLEGQP